MSRLLGVAKQKVRKKAENVFDRLRSSRRDERPASPTSSQQSQHSVGLRPEDISAPSESTGSEATSQAAVVSTSVTTSSSNWAEHSATDTLSLPSAPALSTTPAYARPPSPRTVLATTGSAVKGLLAAARDGSDLFLPLKAALVGVVALWDVWDRTAEAKAEFTKLESKLAAFKAITDAQQNEPREIDQGLQTRLVSIAQAIQGLWETVEQKLARGDLARVVQSSGDLGDVKTLVTSISSLLEVFQFESSIAVEKRLGLIVARLNRVERERIMHMRAKKQAKAIKTIRSALGDNYISEAADDEQPSYSGCMVGTRVDILSKLVTWAKSDPVTIFWLAGMAGTGKTSIVVSLCRMLRRDPEVFLGGGYFCSRSAGSIARTDVRRILPTLAALLADQSEDFAEALAAELEKDRRVSHKPVSEQIGPLLHRPLAVLRSLDRPLVFVIDALDECSNQRELAELLRIIVDLQCDARVKFVLTSRPEIHIRGTPISNPTHNTILHLHTIDAETITSDIRLYISGTLETTTTEETWYTDDNIAALVSLCGGLFIFASTVLLYVLDPEEDEERRDRLRKVTSTAAKGSAATTAIDQVYELVLLEASRRDAVDADELDQMRNILACIFQARTLLSVEALAVLIDIRPSRLRALLRRLHSLVYMPMNDEEPGVRTLHASFGDYLQDRAPEHLRISATLGHDVLARGCLLRLARDDLRFNVSRSRSSFEPNPETVPDFIEVSLIYACLHWAHHVDAASIRSAFDEDILWVFRPKFLFWLEVLSVTNKIGVASGLLRIAASAVNTAILSQFLRDASAFVASSHAAIQRSAPHIYISALPFARKESLIYQDFTPLCVSGIHVETFGTTHHADRIVATLSGHQDAVNSVAYSPDGSFLASGSDDGTVRIWDTRTGEVTGAPLRSDGGGVNSVAFSPNGQRIASGTDGKTVNVWDFASGRAVLPPLQGHTDWVRSVAFSPDGMIIASASYDSTIRLWNAETGHEISVITGHRGSVNQIAFSSDGLVLASASDDRTIRLWVPHTGEAIGNLPDSIDGSIDCLSISLNGKYLAAGSSKAAQIRVWNLITRELCPFLIGNQSTVMSLAFSPDGTTLVSAGQQGIKSWDPHTGRELFGTLLAGHSDWVTSITFSPDGLFIASGSDDFTVRIWNAVRDVSSTIQPLLAHESAVSAVVVSPDGTTIISASEDCSLRVWDVTSGDGKVSPLRGHQNAVFAVAISPDGLLIASASADQTVRLWDAKSGSPIGDSLQGHDGEINAVAFSPDMMWLASGSADGTVRVWDVASKTLASFGPLICMKIVYAVAFSPDGQYLAAADSGGHIHLWISGSNQPARMALWASSAHINYIAFSPNAARIASAGDEGDIRVWDIADGNLIHTIYGHVESVLSVAYSPNSRFIVSSSWDKTVRLWDSESGEALVTLFGHGSCVRSVTFTPDNRSIVSCSDDETIHTWDVGTALSLSSQLSNDPITRLGFAALDDGWVVGSSGELLLWIPAEFRGHIPLLPCLMIISNHRAQLTATSPTNRIKWGGQWIACWSDTPPSA